MRIVGAAIVLLAFLRGTSGHLLAQPRSQRLPDEVIDSLKDQRARYVDFDASFTYSAIEGDKVRVVRREWLKYSGSGASRVTEEDSGLARARVTNSKYTFLAERKTKDGSWLLIDLTLAPNAGVGKDASHLLTRSSTEQWDMRLFSIISFPLSLWRRSTLQGSSAWMRVVKN